jgi:hypothetical protein
LFIAEKKKAPTGGPSVPLSIASSAIRTCGNRDATSSDGADSSGDGSTGKGSSGGDNSDDDNNRPKLLALPPNPFGGYRPNAIAVTLFRDIWWGPSLLH